MKLDYKTCKDVEILLQIEKLINKDIKELEIINIISSKAQDLLNIEEIDDFNGWQCDWWANCEYKGIKLSVFGCAWYGTIEISVYDEEE